MALTSGTKLGPYEIVAPLGAGGMAEVYRAHDTRLERDVAVKVLPSDQTSDSSLRQRLEREARAVSKLSHPHICALYDIGRQDEIDFLVMELVEGETLEQRLIRGPLPTDQTLRYAAQIADALAKAHKNGFTHRDLKPSNIMLTKTGAKLMDFGLAKQGTESRAEKRDDATLEHTKLTEQGTILGTFQYMAPEQLEGREADARTDIFALGEVIYEMATGKPPFAGKSRASLVAAILTAEPPPIGSLQPMTPPSLERVVQKCLAKDPDERWQSTTDLASELKWISEGSSRSGETKPVGTARTRPSREALLWTLCGILGALLIGGALWWGRAKAPEQTMYFAAPFAFPARDIAIAPNGHTIAIIGYLQSARWNVIWIYELGSSAARELPDTQGATYPFWSADGQYVAFFADSKLKKVEVSGGEVQTICDAPFGRGGTWNKDDVIVFTPDGTLGGGLYRVPASGGTPTQISTPDASQGEQGHRWPMFLPDGKHFLYMSSNFSGEHHANAIYVGALDSKEKRFVVQASANAAYAAPGYLLFCRDRTLLVQRFDLGQFAVVGQPMALLIDVQYQPQVRRAIFAVSGSLLVAQTGSQVALSQPIWFDRKGSQVGAIGKPDIYGNLSLSPEGDRVAVDKTDMATQNADIWIYEQRREDARRLTFEPTLDVTPIWSPDGSSLVYTSNRGTGTELYMTRVAGNEAPKGVVLEELTNKFPTDWSRDGKYILYSRSRDLWVTTFPELKRREFLKAPSVVRNARFSPDGKWVVYASNESGKWEIYATSFPEARGKWQISAGGGDQPRWRGDGKEVFYLAQDGTVMAVPVNAGATFDAGTPGRLFQSNPRQAVSLNDQLLYDVSRDGQRFLINTQVKQAETGAMSVVLNWPAKLSK